LVRGYTLCSVLAVTLVWGPYASHAAIPGSDAESGPASPVERPSEITAAAVDELLELSGLKERLVTLAAGLRAQLHHPGMTEQEHATVDRVVARYLGPEMLYARTRLAFGSAVNSSTVAAALAWYRSPLGRRIVAADLDVSADGGRPVTMGQPSAERLPLIERLDEAGGASEAALDITMALVRSLARAADWILPVHARLGPGRLEQRITLTRFAAFPEIRRAYLVNMLVAYRGLDDDELAAYARWVESSAGRWFVEAMNRAVVDAVGMAAELAAVELVTLLPQTVGDSR